MKKYLPIALFLAFLVFGLDAFMQSKPEAKNARVYKTVQKYSPYYIEKRFGGLEILSKENKEFKEKPTNMTFFKEFKNLEKKWAKKHLSIKNNVLIIVDNNGTQIDTLPLNTKEETNFAHHYYGI